MSASVRSERDYQDHRALERQVNTVQQEARMVLPGIQALFGFQLVAVFSEGFHQILSPTEKGLHLVAVLLVAVATVLVLAPAAYHHQANHRISQHFVELSSRFLAWALAPLALGTCVDIFLVARVTLESFRWSLAVSLVFFAFLAWTWFIFPRVSSRSPSGLHPPGVGWEHENKGMAS